ncbi:MAG: ATP-binding protein [Thermoplasmata archaeon]|nr:ATP-binding protein [Thermoplasmata archaeon]
MVQQYGFLDREAELRALEEEYDRGRSSLAVIYGRRRVGKTEITLQLIKKKGGIYFLADRRGYRANLREFQRTVARELDLPLFAEAAFDSWTEMFESYTRVLKERDGPRILVVDEYPYLIEEGANEEFQRIWDTNLSKSGMFLILVGSSMGMMENRVLGYGSPLYGRRNIQLRVGKLPFREVRKFFPRYGPEKVVEAYGLLDGIPLYLRQFTDHLSIEENLRRNYLRKDAFLFEEGEFLLREELREPRRYFGILRTIARGKRTFGEIADDTGLDKASLSKYLSNLHELHIITEDLPLVGGKSRMKRYRISDNYLKAWFRYVNPNKALVETGRIDELLEEIRKDLPAYMGGVLEDIVWDILYHDLGWQKVGGWWNRRGDEIDIVALDPLRKRVLFGEVKWGRRKATPGDLERLMERAEMVPVTPEYAKEYLLVSRAGFTKGCRERKDGMDKGPAIGLWTLSDLMDKITA